MRKQPKGDIMDEYLSSLGLWRKPIAKDGSCLFRVVAEQLFYTQSLHYDVREACVRYMEIHPEKFEPFVEGPFDHHLYLLRNPKEWAGQVEISALSLMYKRDFIIYQDVGRPPVNVTQNNFKDKVLLCFSNGNHYDSVYPRSHVDSAAVCQSIVYELLYKNVLKMDRPLEQATEMVSKSSKARKDSLSSISDKADSPSPEESPLDQREAAHVHGQEPSKDGGYPGSLLKDHKDNDKRDQRTPFPYRVAKALDPDIYRNIEFDSWLEEKKEQQYRDFTLATQLQFFPGDKCRLQLEEHGDTLFHGHIQALSADKGPVIVFIEELGEKHEVPFSSIQPVPQPHHQGWPITGSKGYRQLSGYYQKPVFEPDNQYNRKKNRRRREMPVVIPFGRGQALPPRLQQHNDMAAKSQGVGRGVATNGQRQRQNSGGRSPGAMNGNTRNLPVEFDKDSSAFPALPGPGEQRICPKSFWSGKGPENEEDCSQGSGASQGYMMPVVPPGTVAGHPTLPIDGAANIVNSNTAACGATSSPVATPASTPSPTAPLPPPPAGVPAYGTPPGTFPFYPYLVPHMHATETYPGPINFSAIPSVDPNGSDLPHEDLNSLRFFYNLGCEYYRASSMLQIQQQQQYATYVTTQMVYPPPTMMPAPNSEVPMTVLEEEVNGYVGSQGNCSTAVSAPQGTVYYSTPPGYIQTYAPYPSQPQGPVGQASVVYSTNQPVQYAQYTPSQPPPQFTYQACPQP